MSMFTSRHYEAIAKIIRFHISSGPLYMDETRDLVSDIAGFFKEDNPRFNRDRFMLACKPKERIGGRIICDNKLPGIDN